MQDRFKLTYVHLELELTDEESKGLNDSRFIGTLELDEKYYDLIMEAGFAWTRKYANLYVAINDAEHYKQLALQFLKEAVDNFQELDEDDIPF